jgi:hypothetical protein
MVIVVVAGKDHTLQLSWPRNLIETSKYIILFNINVIVKPSMN